MDELTAKELSAKFQDALGEKGMKILKDIIEAAIAQDRKENPDRCEKHKCFLTSCELCVNEILAQDRKERGDGISPDKDILDKARRFYDEWKPSGTVEKSPPMIFAIDYAIRKYRQEGGYSDPLSARLERLAEIHGQAMYIQPIQHEKSIILIGWQICIAGKERTFFRQLIDEAVDAALEKAEK